MCKESPIWIKGILFWLTLVVLAITSVLWFEPRDGDLTLKLFLLALSIIMLNAVYANLSENDIMNVSGRKLQDKLLKK